MTYKTFDDYLLEPQFSRVKSREECSTKTTFLGMELDLPVISANMDTITGPKMVAAMNHFGGVGALHRFYTLEENVVAFEESLDLSGNSTLFNGNSNVIVSVGLGDKEFERALVLEEVGAKVFLIDVAHAASAETVNQYIRLRNRLKPTTKIIVGNFATGHSIYQFSTEAGSVPDAVKIGIGGGSMCSTRIVTGCGVPTLASILDAKSMTHFYCPPIIADGGLRNSGDICKALAAGASMVMLGGMLSGTDETPGESINKVKFESKDMWLPQWNNFSNEEILADCRVLRQPGTAVISKYKKYRGSASASSYATQGKEASHRTAEGEETLVPYKGSVKDVLQQIKAGIKSSMAYNDAFTLQEFRNNAKLIEVSSNSVTESKPHGVK